MSVLLILSCIAGFWFINFLIALCVAPEDAFVAAGAVTTIAILFVGGVTVAFYTAISIWGTS